PVSSSENGVGKGFFEGNPVWLELWRNHSKQSELLIPEVIEGDLVFKKYGSVFISLNSSSEPADEIHLYPNPARDLVYIRIPVLPVEGVRILFFDGMGRQVVNFIAKSNIEILNIHDLPAGLYFVKAVLRDKMATFKLIVS